MLNSRRRAIQAVLGAFAIASGGFLAVATEPEPETASLAPASAALPSPMQAAAILPTLSEVDVEPVRQPRPERSDPRPQVETPDVETPTVEPSMAPYADALRDGQIITGATPHRLILFTFDDGPDPRNTPGLLDQLDRLGIRAVFFMTASRIDGGGPWERRNQAIAREVVRRGHIVANHTVDHEQLPLLDDISVRAQVIGADAIFERVLGERAWLIRPPGGARSARVDRLLAGRGYTQVLWNLGTGDFQVREPEEVHRIWRRVLARRERDHGDRGGIILLHDTHAWSVAAVPLIHRWLQDRNCDLLAQGEELYDIVDDPRLFFAPRDDDDASAVAAPASPDPAVLERRQARLRGEAQQRCERLASR